jgi:anti-anti-sigma factor
MPSDGTARPPGDVNLRCEVRGATLDVTVSGDLDMAAAFPLETRLDALLAEPDMQAAVLDLSQVTFIDSAGLGALLAIRERAQQHGIELTISRVSDRVQRVLDATGLSDIPG